MCVNYLNTPRRVADETNNIVWKWESTPFGETKPTGTLEFNLRFAGQYFDNETGTHYNINRDYNPVTGRYIQSDPIGHEGGLSTFAYVNGNPVMFMDLEGLTFSQVAPTPVVDLSSERQNEINNLKNDVLNSNVNYLGNIKEAIRGAGIYYVSYEPTSSDHYSVTFGIAVRAHKTINLSETIWARYSESDFPSAKQLLVDVFFHEVQHLANFPHEHNHNGFFSKYAANVAYFHRAMGRKWK